MTSSVFFYEVSISFFAFVAPSEPPTNVTVIPIYSSWIFIKWGKPDKSMLHGNLARYEIEYRRVECNEPDPVNVTDSSWKRVNVASTSLRFVIERLVSWSCYEVRMRAVTVGSGPYCDTIGVRTRESGELLFLCFFCVVDVPSTPHFQDSWRCCVEANMISFVAD